MLSNIGDLRNRIDAKMLKEHFFFNIVSHLLMLLGAEVSDARGCIFLGSSCCAKLRLLDAVLPGTTTESEEEPLPLGTISFEPVVAFAVVVEVVVVVVVVVPVRAWPDWPSTGFLERWRPLFMCRSQYFWSTTASLEHRHFFPSVLLHLPGSGSVLFENPRWKPPHPTATNTNTNTSNYKTIQSS